MTVSAIVGTRPIPARASRPTAASAHVSSGLPTSTVRCGSIVSAGSVAKRAAASRAVGCSDAGMLGSLASSAHERPLDTSVM